MITSSRMGRPLGFDEDDALDAAMKVFWSKSYEGATLSDLTEAMGINRSSMYGTFGDKAALFKLALARYGERQLIYFGEALQKPTAQAVVEEMLQGTAKFLGTSSNPRGCLSIQGVLACGTEAAPVKQMMIEWRTQAEGSLGKRFQQAHKIGDLPSHVDPEDFTRYVAMLMQGLGVQAAHGTSAKELKRAADMAIRFINATVFDAPQKCR